MGFIGTSLAVALGIVLAPYLVRIVGAIILFCVLVAVFYTPTGPTQRAAGYADHEITSTPRRVARYEGKCYWLLRLDGEVLAEITECP